MRAHVTHISKEDFFPAFHAAFVETMTGKDIQGWMTNEKDLEWVEHFNEHTRSRTKGVYRLLILDGHESLHW
jgi:hypothetical protein